MCIDYYSQVCNAGEHVLTSKPNMHSARAVDVYNGTINCCKVCT